jgi:hypothetical protein
MKENRGRRRAGAGRKPYFGRFSIENMRNFDDPAIDFLNDVDGALKGLALRIGL